RSCSRRRKKKRRSSSQPRRFSLQPSPPAPLTRGEGGRTTGGALPRRSASPTRGCCTGELWPPSGPAVGAGFTLGRRDTPLLQAGAVPVRGTGFRRAPVTLHSASGRICVLCQVTQEGKELRRLADEKPHGRQKL